MSATRRRWLQRLAAWAALGANTAARSQDADMSRDAGKSQPQASADGTYPRVTSGRALRFPSDFGAHPAFRTEWWYITGWLDGADGPIGFQVTFFRSRTAPGDDNPSRFAPTQLLFAHAAVSPSGMKHLLHDQRAVRAGFADGRFAVDGLTSVNIGDWSLRQTEPGRYEATVACRQFTFRLRFDADGPPWAQGEAGYSRKGPRAEQASHYYSRPHLRVVGEVGWKREGGAAAAPAATAGPTTGPTGPTAETAAAAATARPSAAAAAGPRAVTGVAWLDHEWSSELLDPDATGWDWLGLNLDDGGALMAFRIRRADGSVLWRHAGIRPGGASASSASSASSAASASSAMSAVPVDDQQIEFEPIRQWRSPRTGIDYPVQMRLRVGGRSIELRPLFDDQELDSRVSTGVIYWEGAVAAYENDRRIGRGYLELTGYGQRVRF